MADALVLGASSIGVWVRPPSPAPKKTDPNRNLSFLYLLGQIVFQIGLGVEIPLQVICLKNKTFFRPKVMVSL